MFRRSMILAASGATLLFTGVAAGHGGHPPIDPPKVSFAAHSAPVKFDLFRGTRIFLEGQVNGEPTAMMFDSGASLTVLDLAYADKLGLKNGIPTQVEGASGKVPGKFYKGIDLTVGGLRMKDLTIMAIDLAPVSRGIGREIPVVLGRDALKASVVTIDFPARTIRFAARADFRAPGGATRLAMGGDGHLPAVKLSVAGLPPIDATLDLGNGGTILLSKAYWEKLPALADLRHAETRIGGVGGMKAARKTTIPEVEFGGVRLTNVPATLNEDATALPTQGGNVGIEMLKPFIVTIDDAGGALYLQSTGAKHDFRPERVGMGTELVGDRLRVAYVSPDGPAHAAGLKAGDEIIAVDGQPVGPDYYSRPTEWARQPAGTRVALKRADGTTAIVTLADYY
ncbi:MAG TPA: aspartyl protease family protein [Sphingomicrobium sp.]|nr:aspartyl protease family protein [Sphingomicrobium sp.]